MKSLSKLCLMLLLIIPVHAFGVDSETGKITGQVRDELSDDPISYATVALVDPNDSSIVLGVITNDEGRFTMEKLPYGEYMLRINYMGYKTKTIDQVKLSRKNKEVELGATTLHQQINNLDEVVVESERIKGEEKIDRTVYTINDETRKMASDGVDVLRQIPAVQVGLQNDISLEGKSNINIYVDGILRDQDYLAQLDPTMIDKVEIMTNPSVKYGADVSGVINIKLSKERRFGISGQIGADLPHPDKVLMDPNARLEYGTQKFRVYVSDRLHLEKFNGFDEVTTKQQLNNNAITYIKNGEGEQSWRNNNLHYGLDYFLNEKTAVNFYGQWRYHQSYGKDFKTSHKTYLNDVLDEEYMTLADNLEKGNSLFQSLFIKREFNDDGHELTLDVNYYDYQGTEDQDYEDIYADDNRVFREEYTTNQRNTSELKLDYSFITGSIKQDIGYHNYYQWMNNKYDNNVSEPGSGFKYNESRQAAYYNLSGKLGMFNWQAGLRGVYTHVESPSRFNSEYWSLLPQMSFQANFKEGRNAKLSYRRSIERPGMNDLNPFQTWTDSLHLWYGNPQLDPSLLNKFEISYGMNIKNNYISPKLYVDYSQNKIQEVSFLNEETGVFEFTKANVGRSYEYGLGVDVSASITKWWQLNGSVQGFQQIIHSDHEFNLDDEQTNWASRFNMYTRFRLPKGFNLFAVVNYSSPTIAYQREFSRDPLLITGMEKEIFKNAVMEFWYVPFVDKFTYASVITVSENIREDWSGKIDGRNIFQLSFKYRFNYGKKVNKIERSVNPETDGGGGAL